MKYNFDEIIDRRNTDCLKYDFAAEHGKPEDVLPLWVADMDFRTAPGIIERAVADAKLGIYGYTEGRDDYFQTVAAWYRNYFDWQVEKEWLVKTPGVVFAIANAVRALTDEGDAVMIQQPVYYPFSAVIRDNGRTLVNNELVFEDGHYEIDFEDFERKVIENRVKLFVLCSPHNPVGRVWTEEELRRIGEICLQHGVKVVSDEIHSDFVYEGRKHHIFTTVNPDLEEISIICTAPSKTFNLAGLQVSNIFIPNEKIRQAFRQQMSAVGYLEVNMIGLHACQAAYGTGREWLEELKVYLRGNLDYARDYLEKNLPQIKLVEPEGTYLLWLDCRGLGLPEERLEHLIVHEAKLWLDAGSIFGAAGEGFERINMACPRAVLGEALERLRRAVEKNVMKYLVIGAGGTGGSIGAYMTEAGKDVTLIARGEHLRQMQEHGLKMETTGKGSYVVNPIRATDMEHYDERPDIIFVCVKGYSLEETIPFIRRVAKENTIVIPILNIYGTGGRMQEKLPGLLVTDGCIYIAGEIKEPGTILLRGDIFRIVYGVRDPEELRPELFEVAGDLKDSGIEGVLSDNIRRDALQKFAFVSPMAACGLYYHVSAGEAQKTGDARDTFVRLMKEIDALAVAMGVPFLVDIVTTNLQILDTLNPEASTSMQRDVYAGKASEIDGLIYEVVRMGQRFGVPTPTYEMIADKARADGLM